MNKSVQMIPPDASFLVYRKFLISCKKFSFRINPQFTIVAAIDAVINATIIKTICPRGAAKQKIITSSVIVIKTRFDESAPRVINPPILRHFCINVRESKLYVRTAEHRITSPSNINTNAINIHCVESNVLASEFPSCT